MLQFSILFQLVAVLVLVVGSNVKTLNKMQLIICGISSIFLSACAFSLTALSGRASSL